MKKISILMSIFNEPIEWISQSILSIINQTYKNIEFIIILDNPKREDVLNLIDGLNDERIIFKVNEKNIGLILSLNKAISLSTGQYIARMDADDISLPSRLDEQIRYLENRDLDLIGCNAIIFSEEKILFKTKKYINHDSIKKLIEYGVSEIMHPTFFGKREVFTKHNGYNSHAIHAEDMEFIACSIANGYKLGNQPKHLVKIRFSNQSITKNNAYHVLSTSLSIQKSFLEYKKSGNYIFQQQKIKSENHLIELHKKNQIYLNYIREGNLNINYIVYVLLITPNITYIKIRRNFIKKILKYFGYK